MSVLLFIIFCITFKNVITYNFEDLDISEDEMKHLMETKFDEENLDDSEQTVFTPYLFDTGVGNRENLYINDISVNENFAFGKGVIDWKEITYGGIQYLIGKQNRKVILIQAKVKLFTSSQFNTIFFNQTEMSFDGEIGPILPMEHINYNIGEKEGFVLVTESNIEYNQDIHWLKITKHGLVKYDTWSNPIKGEITDLQWVKYDFKDYFIIITREGIDITAINIYEFKMQGNKMSLICGAEMKLEHPVSSASLAVEGELLYLVLVSSELHKVSLYRYQLSYNKPGTFEKLSHFTSTGVTDVTSFFQSGRNYFLINGDEPNLLILNQNGTLTSQLHNCGRVHEWLVLKVPTYREDVILLARDDDKVSMLIWMGSTRGFVVVQQPFCFAIDPHMTLLSVISEDAACLAYCPWTGGIALNIGHMPTLLLTCNSQSNSDHIGGLYHFNTSLYPVPGPAEAIVQVLKQVQHLQVEVDDLSKEFEKEGLLKDIQVSRDRLIPDEGWTREWNGLNQCLDQVKHHVDQLTSYIDLRRQNNVTVNLSLHQGKLIGNAKGVIDNQPITTTFTGKIGWNPENLNMDNGINLESDVLINEHEHYNVKASLKFDSVQVTEGKLQESEILPQYEMSYGVSPELSGPLTPMSNRNEQEMYEKLAVGKF